MEQQKTPHQILTGMGYVPMDNFPTKEISAKMAEYTAETIRRKYLGFCFLPFEAANPYSPYLPCDRQCQPIKITVVYGKFSSSEEKRGKKEELIMTTWLDAIWKETKLTVVHALSLKQALEERIQ